MAHNHTIAGSNPAPATNKIMRNQNKFFEGQEVKSIFWVDCGYCEVGKGGVTKITVVMENGQNAPVPWFAVWHGDKINGKYNAEYVEGVIL